MWSKISLSAATIGAASSSLERPRSAPWSGQLMFRLQLRKRSSSDCFWVEPEVGRLVPEVADAEVLDGDHPRDGATSVSWIPRGRISVLGSSRRRTRRGDAARAPGGSAWVGPHRRGAVQSIS